MTTLLTEWGERLDADAVLPEYPRPQLVRDSYLNLNGRWQYAMTPAATGWPGTAPQRWDGEIIVPFSPETPLSGVERVLGADQTLWYRRTVNLPPGFHLDRTVLHFGAVDQHCVVFVDGIAVGEHVGGFTPFQVEISPASDVFELTVAVRDSTDASHHSRGKQRTKRGGIWYSPQSGIWQSVWLESLPRTAISSLTLTPHLSFAQDSTVHSAEVEILIQTCEPTDALATVTVSSGGVAIAEVHASAGIPARVPINEPHLWSPETPFLYDVRVAIEDDFVTSYVGLRSFGTGLDADGIPRLLLNGRPYFAAGVLDQGYWSDGWLTAPSDAAFIRDIELAKSLGFTMLRKHIKVEPLRWYAHCDRIGMLVWQDMVNGGTDYHPAVITVPAFLPLRLRDDNYARFGRSDPAGREQFLHEMTETVQHLRSVTSIAAWVVFNEGWGQFDAAQTAEGLRGLDDSRVIDHASGWHDQGGGDVRSLHIYFRKFRMRNSWSDGTRPVVLSEYGGYSLRIPGHLTTDKKFGYRRYGSAAALTAAVSRLHAAEILPALATGLSASVYTQLSDVEDEDNGLITYDRRVVKVDQGAISRALSALQFSGKGRP